MTKATVSAIYCRDKIGVIGVEEVNIRGDVVFRQPIDYRRDKAFFVQNTLGKTVVMGGNTARSMLLEIGRLLPNRTNVVITRDVNLIRNLRLIDNNVIIFGDIQALRNFIEHNDEDTVIIGGVSLIEQLSDIIEVHYVTEFDVQADLTPLEGYTTLRTITIPIIGSCKSGWVREGFTRTECKKFEDIDKNTNSTVTGYFGEYRA